MPLLIPLNSLDFYVSITNNIARTTITQRYQNDYDQFIEAEYFFPINAEACFDSFEAEYSGKKVRGIIKEKEKAKEEYEHQKKLGNLVAYSE